MRSGGRGKQGGVIRANNAAQLRTAAKKLFNTAFGEETPEVLLADPWLPIERELYLSVTIDGAAEGYVVLYSPKGGIDIEAGRIVVDPPIEVEARGDDDDAVDEAGA